MSQPGAAAKSARERVQIVSAYNELGSYRAAAKLCGTTHKTVRRVVERQRAGGLAPPRKERPKNTDQVAELVGERVQAIDGRISAKRLLPAARAAGYAGSARNLRRAVAEAKARHRTTRRVYRPWVPAPGGHLVIDWTPAGGLQNSFPPAPPRGECAVVVWPGCYYPPDHCQAAPARASSPPRWPRTRRRTPGLSDGRPGALEGARDSAERAPTRPHSPRPRPVRGFGLLHTKRRASPTRAAACSGVE
jgi:hypothetical protein